MDLAKNPTLAREHQIVAVPTLIRKAPFPNPKIIGDLSDTERLAAFLNIQDFKK
jgi:circadian clock protein KaiB